MPNHRNTADAIAAEPLLKVTGDPDVWRLVCKAAALRWMRSTKRMDVPGGAIYQVTTEHRDAHGNVVCCAEALAFVPHAPTTPDREP